MKNNKIFVSIFLFILSLTAISSAQPPTEEKPKKSGDRIRVVTIPISIYTKKELKQNQAEEFLQADRLTVEENGDEKTIISIRSVSDTPLSLAVLIQDDLGTNVNLELKNLGNFIRKLPSGSKVMVAYLSGGTVQIRQKFTDDLEKAADSIRIVRGSAAAAPRNPYDSIIDVLNRFDALPNGRRAILLVSDGLDVSNGLSSSTPGQSIDLDRAILRAQRRSVAIYSFYSPATLTENGSSILILNAQGSLLKLSDETGGRAFFSGTSAPVSFAPFFQDLGILLNRQFAITYLSDNFKKGFYKVKVTSTNPEIKIEHPKGYYYR
jgi:VWFA-related protein